MRAVGHGKRVAMIQWYKSRKWGIGEHKLPELLESTKRYKKVEKSRKRGFGEIEIYPMGEGFFLQSSNPKSQIPASPAGRSNLKLAPLKGGGVVLDTVTEKVHRRAAQEALHLAKELLKGRELWVMRRGVRVSSEDELHRMKSNALSSQLDTQLKTHNPKLFLLILDEVINAVNDRLINLIDLIDLISKRGETHVILTGRGVPKELTNIADLVTEMKNVKHPYDTGQKAIRGLDF